MSTINMSTVNTLTGSIPVKAKELGESRVTESKRGGLNIQLPVNDYRSLPIPGIVGAKLGITYVRVIDIPGALDNFMEINPRVPSRNKAGILNGPVVKGIIETLRDAPDQMVLKNQGIYLLVQDCSFTKTKGDNGILSINFTDIGKHGIINGGHTYAAIREAVETVEVEEVEALKEAYVRLHIFQGIDADYVPEIAEGLNRSRQVDDTSLVNLQGEFDVIRKTLRGITGEKSVAYHQGDSGEIYVSELLVYLGLFNVTRFSERKHPNVLYNRQALGLKYFSEDMTSDKRMMHELIRILPDILWLADSIRKFTPAAAKHNNFKFGAAKVVHNERAGASKHKGILLPFLDERVDYRVPNGWVYPMLASFRANLRVVDGRLTWRVPLKNMLPDVIDELVGICVVEHRDNNMRPELIGKRESAYNQCYTRVQLYLAKKGLLN